MLVARETIERDTPRRTTTTFAIGETVHVVSLGRTGRVSGQDGENRWLVTLTEGDAPVRCASTDLQKRQTLLG